VNLSAMNLFCAVNYELVRWEDRTSCHSATCQPPWYLFYSEGG